MTEVAGSLVGLHSTDPATVFLAAAARLVDPQVEAIERALYEDRTLVRMLGMRRTMWVVPTESVAMVHAACTQAIAEQQRRRLVKLFEDYGIADDGAAWLATVEESTVQALAARGAAFGSDLSADVPALRTQYTYAEGKSYGGTQTATTQVLNILSMDGKIVRGRPRGAWNSSQYRWAPLESWLPEGIAKMDRHQAQVALVRGWLKGFGPGTMGDLKWWTGLSLGDVRRALAELDVAEVDLDGTAGVILAEDLEPVEPPEPWVALLPALDPTPMGWTDRAWYLGDYRAPLFDRSGNIGPTVWCNGRIVGGWAQRRSTGSAGPTASTRSTRSTKQNGPGPGDVAFRLFEDLGAEMTGAVEAAAARLGSWIGDIRVTPRFRTPLERELSG